MSFTGPGAGVLSHICESRILRLGYFGKELER
jgi:hypothetical protein